MRRLSRPGKTLAIDCASTSTSYTDDLGAFEIGFTTLTPLYPPRAPDR